MSDTYYNSFGQPRIVSRHSNFVPLPVGYHESLPDNDPQNAALYKDFHNLTGQALMDPHLDVVDKAVAIAYQLYGIDADDKTIATACSISLVQLYTAQSHLRNTKWLQSSENKTPAAARQGVENQIDGLKGGLI